MDDYEDKQFDKMLEDTHWLTNMNKFFPELAWRKVLEKLKTKDDIKNCSNASPFFGNLLYDKRESRVVLPKVFGILAKRYSNKKNDDDSYKETNASSIPWKGPLSKCHRMTGIWKCRLVCKKWNEAIEEIHRNEDAGHYYMDCEFRSAENAELRLEWGTENFVFESKVAEFLGHFEGTHYDSERKVTKKCPFLGRSVKINYNRSIAGLAKNEALVNSAIEMLEKFGAEVWYLEMECWYIRTTEDHLNVYQKLREIVELVPNLKVLRISYLSRFESLKDMEALEQEIRQNQFPILAKLKMISVDEIPGPICNHIVNRNRHFSHLEFTKVDFHGNCEIFTVSLPNLTRLNIEIDSMNTFVGFENCEFHWKLEKFYLNFHPTVQFVPWSRVLSAIESKIDLDCCIDLRLVMSQPRTVDHRRLVVEESLSYKIKFRNIRRIKIKQWERFCLDFLLPSKHSLREIELCSVFDNERFYHDDLREREIIKFLGCEEKMQDSNIGSELPYLKELKADINGRKRYYFGPDGVKVEEGW